MKDNHLFHSFIKTIDRVLFGINDIDEIEKKDIVDSDNEEEFEVERSNN
jgi:hypothetical protein